MKKYIAGAVLMFLSGALVSESKNRLGLTTFKFNNEKAGNGVLLLTPMLPPKIGFQLVAGKPPERGDVLNCRPFDKKDKDFTTKSGDHPTALMLDCGDSTLEVVGVQFEPEK